MKKTICFILALCMFLSACSFAAQAEEPLNYVVLGDSIARGAGVYNSDKACYGRIVADTCGFGYTNLGIDGLRSWDLIELLGTDEFTGPVSGADVISLSIGGNDYLQQNLPRIILEVSMDNYKIIDDIENDFREYFAEIISIIRELNPDVVIIAQTLYNPRSDLLGKLYGIATARINRVILGYAEENPGEIEIVDTVPYLEGAPECIALDTIHPSAIGNVKLAGQVVLKLNELGLTDKMVPVVNTYGIDELPGMSYMISAVRDIILVYYTMLCDFLAILHIG